MKVMIAYPPLESDKGVPLLSQNRQFQWFKHPTYIYPVAPASAATLLKSNGYDVFWCDGIASEWTYEQFLDVFEKKRPDLVMMETKTPVVKKHWRIISDMKLANPESQIVLVGDHVTALPRESMENSAVDYILTGGDYDFLLLNLAGHLSKGEALEPGIWYRENGEVKNTGTFQLDHDLNEAPFVDRNLTNWKLYAYKNGNYKKRPGTYIMAGRDCWWGRCTFCGWCVLYPKFRVRTPENALGEIEMLIEKYQVKEIMDDTGTFPAGAWLEKFCQGMIERGYNNKVKIDCNMRPGRLTEKQYQLMGEAGFRLILYGLESADQNILDKINKGTRADDIIRDCQMAKEAGLEPHVTCMVGYPWETRESARKTIELAHMLFDKGWVDTLQATIVIPYPGTPLFEECKKNGWLLTEDWDRYDMKEPVIKTEMSNEEIMSLTQGLYKSFITPRFMLRKILSTRSMDDVRFLGRAGKSVLGHLRDFSRRRAS